MGYDTTRFLAEVNEEFICTICMSVLENPTQTPCEHSFCSDCINGWLSIDKTCPVDRRPLATKDLKTPGRVLRNLLNNLDVKCDFQQVGCQAIIKLENLEYHLSKCDYNHANRVIVCDKGCSMTITQQEYRKNDCLAHLAKEIAKLKNLLSCQQQEIDELRLKSDISMNGPLKWQQRQNMSIQEPNILRMDTNPNFNFGFVQSDHALGPSKSSFKIHLSTVTDSIKVWIGLTRKGYPAKTVIEKQSVRFQGHYVKDDLENLLVFLKCKNGNVIECGIEYPNHFIDDGNHTAALYLTVNCNSTFRKLFLVPKDGFYPTIFLRDSFVKVRYYQQINRICE